MGQKPNKQNAEIIDEKISDNWVEVEDINKTKLNQTITLNNNVLVAINANEPSKDYNRIKVLGQGAFAKVILVSNKISGSERAMKVIKKKSSSNKSKDREIENEIDILRRIDHPNIVKIFEFYSVQAYYCLITEYCQKGELYQKIIEEGPYQEPQAAFIMMQILSAINFCHMQKIIHRDLKPENILIVHQEKNKYYHVKICDFGTSKIFSKENPEKTVVGSAYYIAPEVLEKNYSEKCDIWSLGIIMYILLSAVPPYNGESDGQIIDQVRKGKLKMGIPQFKNLSKEAKDLMNKMLDTNPKKRISAAEALKHKWFTKNKTIELLFDLDKSVVQKIIQNLKHYKCTSIMQETALAFLVHNFPQRMEIKNAYKFFFHLDKSFTGKIGRTCFYDVMSPYMDSQEEIDKIFTNLDTDKDNIIGYEEFVRAAVDKNMFLDDNTLKLAFTYFDKARTGKITIDEISNVFANFLKKSDKQQSLLDIMKEIDEDGMGEINFENFKSHMQTLNPDFVVKETKKDGETVENKISSGTDI